MKLDKGRFAVGVDEAEGVDAKTFNHAQRAHRVFALMKRWGLGTYHGLRRKHIDTYLNEFVFRYNRRFYRHVSFETMRGLAAHHHPTSYWDIVGRDNPREGVPTVRREPRRRRTATGMQADRSRPPEKVEPSPVFGFDPSALDIDQPGTTG
jgi:hypothetical protein